MSKRTFYLKNPNAHYVTTKPAPYYTKLGEGISIEEAEFYGEIRRKGSKYCIWQWQPYNRSWSLIKFNTVS